MYTNYHKCHQFGWEGTVLFEAEMEMIMFPRYHGK